MKKIALVSLFCVALFSNNYAQTKQESIKTLFQVMHQDSLIDKMFNSIFPAMMGQMEQQMQMDSVTKMKYNDMMNTMIDMIKGISKRMINEDMVALYDKYFTQSEINDYIAFYKSPSGQKMINIMPDIQKEITVIMMQKYMPEIQKTMMEKTKEIMTNDSK